MCSRKQCPGVCSAWGEGHYRTFDEKMFDFVGNCEYILARGVLSDTDSFSIHIKNVPCGTSSVTCSKAATLQVGGGRQAETLTFVRGEDVIVGPQYKRHEFLNYLLELLVTYALEFPRETLDCSSLLKYWTWVLCYSGIKATSCM